jgi:MoxR-like ATPase
VLEPVTDGPGLATLFALVDRVHLPLPVAEFIGRLVEGTHPSAGGAPDSVRRFVRYGASPRAALALAASARAWALAKGKPNVGFDEVKDMASAVLNHRLVLSYEAGLERVSAEMVAEQILSAVPEVARG